MLQKIRKSKVTKVITVCVALNFLIDLANPLSALALTGGPSQPEVESFEPIGTTEMVDLFSGDFVYNIPLLDVGGYPVNLSYHSGITMDQEASWTGLGWNVNPGAITRNMRGLPDDFQGDEVTQEFNMKKSWTFGINTSLGAGVLGLENIGFDISVGLGVKYNNYTGVGIEHTYGAVFNIGKSGKTANTASLGFEAKSSADEGLTLTPSASFSVLDKKTKNTDIGLGGHIGASFNSRAGLKSLSLGGNISNRGLLKYGSGRNLSFADHTYIPQIDMPKKNFALGLTIKFPLTFFGIYGNVQIPAYYNENYIPKEDRKRTLPAYGYMYSRNYSSDDQILLDFNREKDMPFSNSTPNLPVTNFTYDAYSISGQGVGGMFRPFRNDVGYIYDARTKDKNKDGSLGFEVGGGNAFHIGGDSQGVSVTGESGRWNDAESNPAAQYFAFKREIDDNKLFEPFYFKLTGETAVDSDPDNEGLPGFFSRIGGFEPVQIPLEQVVGNEFNIRTKTELIDYYGNTVISDTDMEDLYRKERQKRNTSISHLTKKEVSQGFGVQGVLNNVGEDHHIHELTVLKSDGSRYVYGLPAYNLQQEEVTFNIYKENSDANSKTGLVSHTEMDASVDNDNGKDHYYNRSSLPPYAHSYMLTAILSPDYVDKDNIPGPSEKDLGSYTLFEYEPFDTENNYKWRVPYEAGKANYNQGLKSEPKDDKGGYLYGEKQLYYLKKITTETQVAVFNTSDRLDAMESEGEYSGTADKHMKKLDKISLYSKPEYDEFEENATPIKEVHFVYDYLLCPNIPNNTNYDPEEIYDPQNPYAENIGKLTLKALYFTYMNSDKGMLNSYKFKYDTENPYYNLKNYDRWGYYKPNPLDGSYYPEHPALNAEFPYVEQDKEKADLYSSAWSLTEIDLPSGGKINVEYESDDYAYVQDRRAMQMFTVAGASNTNVEVLTSFLYEGENENVYFFIDLPEQVNDNEDFYSKYLRDIYEKDQGLVYFKFLVSLTDNALPNAEYIPGYAQIDGYGMINSNKAYIKLKEVQMAGESGKVVNPISKATWHYGRIHRPQLVLGLESYGTGDDQPSAIEQIVLGFVNGGIFSTIQELILGVNGKLRSQSFGRLFVPHKSFFRLMNPNHQKFGGGSRVKKLVVYDRWDIVSEEMSDVEDNSYAYGRKYEYTTETGKSTGVASYEPMVGGDEIPFRQPKFFEKKNLLVPDEINYQEEPYGECFYPSPGVGYSRIKVTNILRKDDAEGTVPSGYNVYKFYTARDFPTKQKRTIVIPKTAKTGIANNLSVVNLAGLKDYVYATQGFMVELNDMHGKPKSVEIYGEGTSLPNSKVEYIYQQDGNDLDNEVTVIYKNGTVGKETVGIDYDIIADFRENISITKVGNLQGNTNGMYLGIGCLIIPSIFGGYSKQELRFRSAVITKVINRYGLLKQVKTTTFKSLVKQENIAYDAETGQVLLTSLTNNFDKPVYNFTYPAHWSYDRMGLAYQNIGALLDNQAVGSNGTVQQAENKTILVPGDEVSIGGTKYWVWDPDEDNSDVHLINKAGQPLGIGSYNMKVLRSGRRNQQSTPVGSVTSMKFPLIENDVQNPGYDMLVYKNYTGDFKILDAQAVEFSENWGVVLGQAYDYTQYYLGEQLVAFLNDLAQNNQDGEGNNDLTDLDTKVNMHLPPYNDFVELISQNGDPATCGWPECTTRRYQKDNLNENTLMYEAWFKCLPDYCCHLQLIVDNYPNKYCDFTQVSYFTFAGIQNDIIYLFAYDEIQEENILMHVGKHCIPIEIDSECEKICGPNPGEIINPYIYGLRGNWRAKRSHSFITDRMLSFESEDDAKPNLKTDGKYTGFEPFWKYQETTNNWYIVSENPENQNWVAPAVITKYSSKGQELENYDALERYSSAQFGFANMLPVAMVINGKYREMGFDSFEDYDFFTLECDKTHLSFLYFMDKIVEDESHTGFKCIKADPNAYFIRYVSNSEPGDENDDMPYTLKEADDDNIFSPLSHYNLENDRRYTVSYWVKCKDAAGNDLYNSYDYDHESDYFVEVTIDDEILTINDLRKTDIIDGWQKVDFEFIIPQNETGCLKLEFESRRHKAYIDDVRIHTFKSNMKSFVYDDKLLRLRATLDENNFATFYEYDEEGALKRVKKETERGIVTIQEVTKNIYKKSLGD